MLTQVVLGVIAVFVVVLASVYQIVLAPTLELAGFKRAVAPLANTKCTKIEGLQACEKFTLYLPSGIFYLACTTPQARSEWCPALDRLNGHNVATSVDYFAVFDPSTPSKPAQRLQLKGFYDPRGIYVHGMDVVQSSYVKDELFVYAINHRPPIPPLKAVDVGADSVIEIFKTKVGSTILEHLHTVKHDIIETPNDLVGSPDGGSFWFTNDSKGKVGYGRALHTYLPLASTNVGYCQLVDGRWGCKVAADNLRSSNGITAKDGKFYVASTLGGQVTILEQQKDNSLVVTDVVKLDRCLDNISLDEEGNIYVASFPRFFDLLDHIHNTSILLPSSAHRISINTGKSSFFGEKYKVEKIFEDDGQIAPAITTVVWDSKHKKLWLHGLTTPWLLSCDI